MMHVVSCFIEMQFTENLSTAVCKGLPSRPICSRRSGMFCHHSMIRRLDVSLRVLQFTSISSSDPAGRNCEFL